MQKHVNLVDLVKSFQTNVFLQNLASIQKKTSPMKFSHLAEKSEKSSTSNLSTKGSTVCSPASAPWVAGSAASSGGNGGPAGTDSISVGTWLRSEVNNSL